MLSKEKINPSLKNTKRQGSDNLAAMADPTSLKNTGDYRCFNSKPEAYTYFIFLLNQWQTNYMGDKREAIAKAIDSIKMAYENHEQDTSVVHKMLHGLSHLLEQEHADELNALCLVPIKDSQSNANNILPRRFESELACRLIESPTKSMMQAIDLVSQAIINLIEEYSKLDSKSSERAALNFFLQELEGADIEFGAFKKRPSLEEVIAVLKENNPKNFIQIQFISFMFARSVIGPFPLRNLPSFKPTGLFAQVLDKYLQDHPDLKEEEEGFSYQLIAAKNEAEEFRTFITKKLFYQDELYTQGENRGRQGPRKTHLKTNQLGLMKLDHSAHSRGLTVIPEQTWCADAQAQEANQNSIYYKTALTNDCPYVTGPSGMTSIYMNMMLLLLNPQNIELIQAYSLGIIAYIVGAGFHSVNEILIPLVKCINLLPNYPSYEGLEYLTHPPLYHEYFKQIAQFDSDFIQLRDQVWAYYLNYFKSCYMPLCMRDFCEAEQLANCPAPAPEVKILCDIVLKSIEDCINFHNLNRHLDSRFLGTTTADIDALNQLKEACASQSSISGIMRLLQKYFSGENIARPTAMHKFETRSYIRFFLDALKNNPQIISHINEKMKLDPPLVISTNAEIFSDDFRIECFNMHRILKREHQVSENCNNTSQFLKL
ncbi:TPA: hypothetical protein KKX32_001159 [Legionella pneumophila]|uniref:hypothetical protein n=1 Tax=Legionella pneumophila TaxID=446 RepID=UPI0005B3D920|nr:hypothetical protein [Legionella pneumophila]AMQ26731.1 hypothetical protein lpt_01455 [Legionella pneumophila subsp. pneumophila]AMV12967.1 hypothetical protein ULM_02650 [Legionella pneumophila]ANN91330.1 hypothetical protein A9P85_01285 [Legionella pneumophila]MBN5929185.1 hypothetical protein [Legionella pneumophila]MCZ4679362.1 hypothetical protein [Legionella pneumophila]